MCNCRESLEYQGTLESQADFLDLPRLFRVVPHAAKGVVKETNEIADIVLAYGTFRTGPMKKIEDLEIELQSVALHDDVLRV